MNDENQCVLTRAADELADGSAVSAIGASANVTDVAVARRAVPLPLSSDSTASRPIDDVTRAELESLVGVTVAAGGVARFTAIRSPGATFEPVDPGDRVFESSFNGHQRRVVGHDRLSGAEAAGILIDLFRAEGWSAHVTDAPLVLDASNPRRLMDWLTNRVDTAVAQRPALREWADEYLRTRSRQLADGTLRIVVHAQDLLVWSP